MHKKHTLFLITGMPATGKTLFAQQLAIKKGACLKDIDTASEPIIQAATGKPCGNPNDRDSSLFKSTFREPIYSALFALAAANLSSCPRGTFHQGAEQSELDRRNPQQARSGTRNQMHLPLLR